MKCDKKNDVFFEKSVLAGYKKQKRETIADFSL